MRLTKIVRHLCPSRQTRQRTARDTRCTLCAVGHSSQLSQAPRALPRLCRTAQLVHAHGGETGRGLVGRKAHNAAVSAGACCCSPPMGATDDGARVAGIGESVAESSGRVAVRQHTRKLGEKSLAAEAEHPCDGSSTRGSCGEHSQRPSAWYAGAATASQRPARHLGARLRAADRG